MKGPLDRTKIVLRHLPHTISQSALMEQIDARFSGRYNWFSFRSGKQSLKCQSYSRAYIDFKQPEDVIEFAEFFDGHVFVNEKGTQFKTIVEYAPSQRVPKQWSKKDGREGTIVKDPEYLEFLESVSKPVENLPSAEIQLERKEAERAGAGKEAPIVTALMDFIRQKRAAKGGPRRSLPNGKLMRRGTNASSSNSNSTGVKRGSEKRTSTMYVLREGGKNSNGKEKSTYVKRAEKSSTQSGSVVLDEEKASDIGKKKILLLKGKEKEIPNVTTGVTPQQKVLYGGRQNQNQRNDGSGRIIRSILLKDTQQNQSLNQDNKDRRPPRPQNVGPGPLSNGLQDDGFNGEKQDKQHSRNNNNKEKPDRVVWTPLRRSDGLQSDESFLDTTEGTRGESKNDLSNERGRGGQFSSDNGSYKHSGRRTSPHNAKDLDISSNSIEGKSSKRAGYSSHEKRVWVQKPSSGS